MHYCIVPAVSANIRTRALRALRALCALRAPRAPQDEQLRLMCLGASGQVIICAENPRGSAYLAFILLPFYTQRALRNNPNPRYHTGEDLIGTKMLCRG